MSHASTTFRIECHIEVVSYMCVTWKNVVWGIKEPKVWYERYENWTFSDDHYNQMLLVSHCIHINCYRNCDLQMQKLNNYTHTFDLCWTFSFSILHCSSWYFSLALIPSPVGPLRTSSCVALFSPLHFYIALILSLSHFLSVLSSFSLSLQLSSTTGLWNSFQVLICISQRSPPFCLLFCAPLSLSSWLASLSICALVCALQLFIHIWRNTPWFLFLCCL